MRSITILKRTIKVGLKISNLESTQTYASTKEKKTSRKGDARVN